MGKKRKAPTAGDTAPKGPNLDVGASKKRIRDFEDVADSDDEFHINRDRVLLDEGPQTKRRRNVQEQEEFLEPSDEEVLGYSGEEDEGSEDGVDEDVDGGEVAGSGSEDEYGGRRSADDDEDEEMPWGTSKEDLYGADAIETEEQALEEEAEALRLQKKQLQSMSAADYGFDESEWQDRNAGEVAEDGDVVTEKLPQLQVSSDMPQAEKLKLLKSRYPEFEPLSRELLDLKEIHGQLVKDAQAEEDGRRPNAEAKFRAASAYLGALTMYFALLTSPASNGAPDVVAMSAVQLRDHPVMDTLVKCRELWMRAKDLPEDVSLRDEEDTDHDSLEDGMEEPVVQAKPKKAPVKSRAERHAEATKTAADARKAEKRRTVDAELADLDDLTVRSKAKKAFRSRPTDDGSDAGEDAPLTAQEAAEKAKRKKSLRFYTSQIAQKANKRGAAGRNAGGDDDIPYRERLRDRQARLNAEAEKRGRRDTEADADLGGDSDEEDARQARDVRANGEEDYYDLVASRIAKKKSDKATLADAQKQAALQGGQVVEQEVVGEDGKRKISYMIEKNKGLTPHRKKDVRNPRVKKRKKFDEKKKKLGSIKPVYKGGEGRGGYGGELTGIKKGLVKSTKL